QSDSDGPQASKRPQPCCWPEPSTMTANARSRAWLLLPWFGAVGLVNAGFGYAVFALVELMGSWPGAGLAGATISGVAFNFQTSRRLVFRAKGHILWFIAVYSVVLALNWTVLRAL